MLEFSTAVEQDRQEPDETTPILLDKGTKHERTLQAHQISEGQFAVLMTVLSSRSSTDMDAIAAIFDAFGGLFDEEDQQYLWKRLMDRNDSFSKNGIAKIQEILEALVEEWSGRPTKSLSVSTSSPESDGLKSNPTTPPSTSSDSLFTSS